MDTGIKYWPKFVKVKGAEDLSKQGQGYKKHLVSSKSSREDMCRLPTSFL